MLHLVELRMMDEHWVLVWAILKVKTKVEVLVIYLVE